jgi:choline dehydrogenase-like flavoprotein
VRRTDQTDAPAGDRPTRRDVLKAGAAAMAVTGLGARAEARAGAAGDARVTLTQASPAPSASQPALHDFVVVGSGAGGGTVAARLVESGFRVLLLEAGLDPLAPSSGNARPEDYQVPAFHPFATENPSMRWDFWVRHYANDAQQRRDPKYFETWDDARVDGVWYPRAAALGGCTAHNAMIFVAPHDADWNEIADLTGDASWRAERMQTYFRRVENCRYRPFERWKHAFGANPSGHGWSGWLDVEKAEPSAAVRDRDLRETILASIRAVGDEIGPAIGDPARLRAVADPNDRRAVQAGAVGLRYTPLSTRGHVRVGARERLLDVQQRFPDRLTIVTGALATRVLFDGTRAVGVEYLEGERLYGAHPAPRTSGGTRREARAAREVILAGGVFNTPQLLMLSGVGPADALRAHGVDVRVDLPGVGRGLQDRYEVSVVNRMAFDAWKILDGATFTTQDAQYREWLAKKDGAYITNGSLMSVIANSSPGRPSPDLFCYALLARFAGYHPTYAEELPPNPNCLTWVVLKGHTNNTGGRVTLASADPRVPPRIDFHYFDEGTDATGDDLRATVAGVKLVRALSAKLRADGLIAKEELPGDEVQTDDQIAAFVRNTAWGHHASCTCRIGPADAGGVVDNRFRVHGTEGLRVVDASVFPRTPGLFIVSAIYMIGEKAADVIAASARGEDT